MKKNDNEEVNMKKRFEVDVVKRMSEKRFEIDVDYLLLIWDTEKNKRLEIEDIIDLLNKLYEENKQLKQKEKILNKIWRSYLKKGDKKYITDSTCIRFVGDDDE